MRLQSVPSEAAALLDKNCCVIKGRQELWWSIQTGCVWVCVSDKTSSLNILHGWSVLVTSAAIASPPSFYSCLSPCLSLSSWLSTLILPRSSLSLLMERGGGRKRVEKSFQAKLDERGGKLFLFALSRGLTGMKGLINPIWNQRPYLNIHTQTDTNLMQMWSVFKTRWLKVHCAHFTLLSHQELFCLLGITLHDTSAPCETDRDRVIYEFIYGGWF